MSKYIVLESCRDCSDFTCRRSDEEDRMKCHRCNGRAIVRSELSFPSWCPLMGREQLEDRWMDEDERRLGITGSCIGDRDSL